MAESTTLARKAAAEAVGTAFLLATVVGSGIMGERLAGGNFAIALSANTLATGADATAPLCGKYHREMYSPGENFEKVQFENAQIRATRLACAKTCELPAGAQPALLVVLSPMRLKSSGRGERLEPGGTKWVAAGKKETVENTGQTHAEFLRFDFKTKPVKGDGKEAQHERPRD